MILYTIIILLELKETELLNERLGTAAAVDPYLGKYFSLEYVRRHVLKQKDEEIIEIDKQIEKEIKDGKLMDPMEMQQLEMGLGGGEDLGVPVTEPGIDGSAVEALMDHRWRCPREGKYKYY